MHNNNFFYKDNSLINSKYFPLLNITYLNNIDNDFLNKSLSTIINKTTISLDNYPNFRNITADNIVQLRLMLHLGENSDKLDSWCIKLLRYIEINLSKLVKNEKSFNRTKESSILIFQQIKALFIEYYIIKNDILYLNTALKISDIKRFTPTSKTPNSVKKLNLIKERQIEHILIQLTNE